MPKRPPADTPKLPLPRAPWRAYTTQHLEEAKRLLPQGYHYEDLARMWHRNPLAVKAWCLRHGLKLASRKDGKRPWTEADKRIVRIEIEMAVQRALTRLEGRHSVRSVHQQAVHQLITAGKRMTRIKRAEGLLAS